MCNDFVFLMIRRPPRSTRTDTLFPYTTLFRAGADPRLPAQIAAHLIRWTGQPWDVRLSRAEGEPTLREQAVSAKAERFARVADHPVVARVLELFPGARIEEVTAPPQETAVAPEDDDDGGDPDTGAREDHAPEASTRSKANQA